MNLFTVSTLTVDWITVLFWVKSEIQSVPPLAAIWGRHVWCLSVQGGFNYQRYADDACVYFEVFLEKYFQPPVLLVDG